MMRLDEGNSFLSSGQVRRNANLVEEVLNSPASSTLPLFMALCLAMGNAADAVEIMCVGFIMTDLDDAVSSEDKELLSSAVFIGMLIGGVVCGYMSDYIGRRPCLLVSLGVNTIAGFISAVSPTISGLIVCRVIGGLGIGGSVPVVFSLGAEIFPSNVRGKYLSVIASFWMIGAIYTAFTAWIMLGDDASGDRIMSGLSWRHFAAVSALPAMFSFVLTYAYIPESPRYLMGKKLYPAARESILYLTGITLDVRELEASREEQQQQQIVDGPQTLSILHERESSHSSKTSLSFPLSPSSSSSSSSSQNQDTSTIVLLFSDKLRRTTIILMIIWFTLCFGTYGISTWISTLFSDVGIGNPYMATFIFALANLPGNVISILFVDVYGRLRLLAGGMCLAGISCLGFALNTSDVTIVLLCSSLFNAFSVIGWNSLDCVSVEYFPTNVRTSAMGVLAATGRLGAVIAQFVNGSLENNVPVLLFVTSACTICGGLATWLLPNDQTGSGLTETEHDEKDDFSLNAGHSGISINATDDRDFKVIHHHTHT